MHSNNNDPKDNPKNHYHKKWTGLGPKVT